MEVSKRPPPGHPTTVAEMFARKRESGSAPVFQNKALLDSSMISSPTVGREDQFRQLVDLTADAGTGYLPALVQVYGPPGTGKSTLVKQVVKEAEAQFPDLRTVIVNLKECRSLFSAANQILFQLTDTKEPTVAGLDGIFEKIWKTTQGSKFLILVLDEIDAIFEDKRYVPSDFLYRLLQRRQMAQPPLVCIITITNLLMGIDSLLDSRVRSRMGTASVYFPPYREDEILAIIEGRRDAFRPETLAPGVLRRCARLAAEEHGDARRALDLLRTAGEVADAEGAARVELSHVERADTVLQAERTTRVIQDLPIQEIVLVNALSLAANEAYGTIADEGKVTPPENPAVPTDVVFKRYCRQAAFWNLCPKGRRRFLDFLQDLEMHGLIGSATESSGRYGRRKLVWILGDPINIGYAAHYHLVHQCRPDLMMYAVGAPSDY